MKKTIVIIFAIAVVFSSCKKNEPQISYAAQLAKDKTLIDNFLATSGINNVFKDSSGLRYTIQKVGKGLKPTVDAQVYVKLDGGFLNGQVFNSDTTGSLYTISDLVPGLQTGLTLMTKGSTYTFYVPSGLAFGAYGSTDGTVPGNTNLVFKAGLLDDEGQLAKDDSLIDVYLKDHNGVLKNPSGLRYVILNPGTGVTATANSTVTVDYVANYLGGAQFDAGKGAVFNMANVIKGWQVGIPLIKNGGHIVLYVPSGLGYGFTGSNDGTIKPNKNLVFDITLNYVN